MIEKLPHIRKKYNLDDEKWNNPNFVKQMYKETLHGYPMVNVGKMFMFAGAGVSAIGCIQLLQDPIFVFEIVGGGIIFSSGFSFTTLSETQAKNYIYHLEADARFFKDNLKKKINFKNYKSQEQER